MSLEGMGFDSKHDFAPPTVLLWLLICPWPPQSRSSDKWLTSVGSPKKREFQKNIYFCFIDYAKVFDCVDHNKLWKILKEMEIPDHLTCLLRNCMQIKKQQLELDKEQLLGSNWERSTARLYIVTLLI